MKNIVIVLLLISSEAFTQETQSQKGKIYYFFAINSGMLAGDKAKSITYTANTVHGVTLGDRLRVGAGAGLDTYQGWQTIPLFGQVTYDLIGTKNVVFVQLNYGWAHAWMQKQQWSPPTTEHGGRMFNSMIGYRISTGNVRLYAAAGYKFQSVSSWYDFSNDQPGRYFYGRTEKTELNFERVMITIGVGWK